MDRHAWDERYSTEDLLWGVEPNRFLVEETGGLAPGRALDLATGHGRNAVWLAEQGWSVTGVDFSEVGLAKAGDLAGAPRRRRGWVAADLNAYEPEDGAYDLVDVLYLQLPEPELRRSCGGAALALAPGRHDPDREHDLTNLTDVRGRPEGRGRARHPESLATPCRRCGCRRPNGCSDRDRRRRRPHGDRRARARPVDPSRADRGPTGRGLSRAAVWVPPRRRRTDRAGGRTPRSAARVDDRAVGHDVGLRDVPDGMVTGGHHVKPYSNTIDPPKVAPPPRAPRPRS